MSPQARDATIKHFSMVLVLVHLQILIVCCSVQRQCHRISRQSESWRCRP